MFLENYYKIMAMHFNGNPNTAVRQNGNSGGVYKTSTYWGDVFGIVNTTYGFTLSRVQTSTSGTTSGVMFGTGTEPVSFTDYKLSGSVVSGITASVSESAGSDETGVYKTATYTLTNTNSTAVTIGEVGAVVICCNSTSTSSSDRYPALVERTVLDSPVTIPAGGIGQVTYTIRFDYPTA